MPKPRSESFAWGQSLMGLRSKGGRPVGSEQRDKGRLKVWLLQFAYSRSINRRNYLAVWATPETVQDDR
jgi:hypothetical protein